MSAVAVFDKVDKLKPLYDAVYYVVMQICKLFLVGTIVVTCWMVAGRFFAPYISSPPWTEEIILTFMSYMSMLAAALALRRGAHIRLSALDPYLNKNVIKVLDLLADIGIMYFSYLLLTEGWAYTATIGGRGFYTSMPTVPLTWRFLPVPVGGFFMIFFNIEITYNHIKAFFVKEADAK